ncbi:MAG TPA: beta-N-acetylhexosaminidase [Nocardioidaceae bacterium]|nr:beta-N-acetylhexosaminidase [Nocardioidaceae bacterium]
MTIPSSISAGRRTIGSVALGAAVVLVSALLGPGVASATPPPPEPAVIPAPASMTAVPGEFALTPATRILLGSDAPGVKAAADALAEILRPSTGYPVPVAAAGDQPATQSIKLQIADGSELGEEGYRLDVSPGTVLLRARTAAGLFYGVQTLRQLLPAEVESDSVQPGPWTVPAVHVSDEPRFAWRGAMLDVARHFFSVDEVKRYIDLLAMYKVNVLHLHLADDQGWRIEIDGWPRLTTYGGSTEVGGGPGGYYTKAEYAELIDYAQQNHIMVVPEIDMPGHTNAALASYPELNCDGVAPPLYTGTRVGFSSLCIDKQITYEFVDDVVRELAAMTPGPYIHLGGDEAHSTPHEDYVTFVNRAQEIVSAHGKQLMGWEEITGANVSSSSVAQHWWDDSEARTAVEKGMKLVMSPAEKTYIDMKYDASTPLGLSWAGYTSVEDAYDWDPASWAAGVPEESILGPEAPLWSETLENIDDVEFMAFPRMPGIAELGWSPAEGRSWDEYQQRLGAQGPRWDVMSVNYYRASEVPWQD